MHIPDGFLDCKISSSLNFAALLGLTYVWQRVKQLAGSFARALASVGKQTFKYSQDNIFFSKIFLVAGLLFALQWFNFPVAHGSSGHLLGGLLAALLLGPWAGAAAVFIVLVVQCFFFGDGGIVALGANIFNMVFLTTLGGYGIFMILKKVIPVSLAIFIAGWTSVIVGALAVAVELSCSGLFNLSDTINAMFQTHFLIGLFEGFITLMILPLFNKLLNE